MSVLGVCGRRADARAETAGSIYFNIVNSPYQGGPSGHGCLGTAVISSVAVWTSRIWENISSRRTSQAKKIGVNIMTIPEQSKMPKHREIHQTPAAIFMQIAGA